ncbi:MAG: DNA recombination protein RmuC [Agarilytica sp.]
MVLALAIVAVLLYKKLNQYIQAHKQLKEAIGTTESRLKEKQAAAEQTERRYERELTRLETLVEEKTNQQQQQELQLESLNKTKEEHLQLQARFEEKEKQLQSKEALLEESKRSLLKEFELAAGKLFDSKQQSFSQQSIQGLETVLNPFKQQLQNFNKQVEEVYHKENTQRNQLIGQIGELQKQTQKISADANNLASALKGDNKVQGQWGEIVLERLLEQSGLEKGREYDTQLGFKSDTGQQYRPDVVIHLPEEKDIVVDSKASLVEYERYASAQDESDRAQALKGHIDSIKTHIKGLSLKKYEQLEGIKTLDFVFMFVPIEAAYVIAVQSEPGLFKEAYDKNIMIVSPSSLMVALRTVETMWRYEKQNKNAEKIATSAGRLYDQFVLVMTALEEVGSYINKAGESYDTVFNRLSSGRGNILKRIDDIKKLGAKASKQLPKETQKRLDAERDTVSVASEAPQSGLLFEKSDSAAD